MRVKNKTQLVNTIADTLYGLYSHLPPINAEEAVAELSRIVDCNVRWGVHCTYPALRTEARSPARPARSRAEWRDFARKLIEQYGGFKPLKTKDLHSK